MTAQMLKFCFLVTAFFALLPGLTAAPPESAAEADASPVPEAAAAEAGRGDDRRFYGRLEYLLWTVRGSPMPAVAGTLPAVVSDLSRILPGGTISPVLGGSGAEVDYGARSGVRLEAGAWLGAENPPGGRWGVEAGFFLLEHGAHHGGVASDGTTVVGPVFTDAAAGRDVLIMYAVPGLRAGGVSFASDDQLWGAEANARWRVADGDAFHLDFLGGYRHLQFDEGTTVTGVSRVLPGGHMACG